VQADTHTITAINPTHMTCFHLVNTVFQSGTISVSSSVPDSLAGRRLPLACQGGSLPDGQWASSNAWLGSFLTPFRSGVSTPLAVVISIRCPSPHENSAHTGFAPVEQFTRHGGRLWGFARFSMLDVHRGRATRDTPAASVITSHCRHRHPLGSSAPPALRQGRGLQVSS
jgi:hypothetical protein